MAGSGKAGPLTVTSGDPDHARMEGVISYATHLAEKLKERNMRFLFFKADGRTELLSQHVGGLTAILKKTGHGKALAFVENGSSNAGFTYATCQVLWRTAKLLCCGCCVFRAFPVKGVVGVKETGHIFVVTGSLDAHVDEAIAVEALCKNGWSPVHG